MTGRRIGADEAKELGLIDVIDEGEPRELALRHAQRRVVGQAARPAAPATWRSQPDSEALSQMRGEAGSRRRPTCSRPFRCVDAVAASHEADRRGPGRRAATVSGVHRQPAARRSDPRLLRRARGAEDPRGGRDPARDATASASSAAAPWAPASRRPACSPACRSPWSSRTRTRWIARGATIEKNLDGAVEARQARPQRSSRGISLNITGRAGIACQRPTSSIEAVYEDLEVKQDIFDKLDADRASRRDPRHQHQLSRRQRDRGDDRPARRT